MFHNIPIIGIVGGIGSGKSFVARLFAELGAVVINSDEQVARAYGRSEVREALRRWWGDESFQPDGSINRRFIARKVFSDPAERMRLEQLLHPIIAAERDEIMREMALTNPPKAFIWDAPLLIEAGLAQACDAVIFVDTPVEERVRRVKADRGWEEAELLRRENSQLSLDNKRSLSDYVVTNPASAAPSASDPPQNEVRSASDPRGSSPNAPLALREQVRLVFSRILEAAAGTGKA